MKRRWDLAYVLFSDWLAVCLIVWPLTQFAFAQSSRVKSTTTQVVVDVVVTDDANQPVTGLSERDFQVFENHKKQHIRSFEAHEATYQPTVPFPEPPLNTFTNVNSSQPDAINVILLDQLNTSVEDQRLARRELIDFLAKKPTGAAFTIFSLRNDDEACQPYDYARLSFGITDSPAPDSDWACPSMGRLQMVQGITQDKERLIAALKSSLARPRRTWLRQRVGVNDGGVDHVGPWIPGQSPIPRTLIPSVLAPWTTLGPRAFASVPSGWICVVDCIRPASYDSYGIGPLDVYDTSMAALAEIGHFLQNLPGRKSLIWMSDSFDAAPIAQKFFIWFPPKFRGWERTDPFSPVQMIHLTSGRLALDRVAIYPADLSGRSHDVDMRRFCGGIVRTPGTLGFTPVAITIGPESADFSCDDHSFKLSYVAAQSGGAAFHGWERAKDALTRAAIDQAHYYTLTYSPTGKFDGDQRDIKITINRNRYHLTYRKSYYADDPSTLNRPETAASPDLYVRNPDYPVVSSIPWKPIRVSDLIPAQSDESKEPILTAMRYGAPESNDVVFSAHVEPIDQFAKATPDQMRQFEDYDSFRTERAQNVVEHLTAKQMKAPHKGRIVLGALPPADPVFVQPYSIDYLIPGEQLRLTSATKGGNEIHLEVAILAYDALGRKVSGLMQTIVKTVSGAELQEFQSSDYQVHQTIEIPDRTALLRLAVRDVSGTRVGSLEIPVWTISSPYKRKQLELPPDVDGRDEADTSLQ